MDTNVSKKMVYKTIKQNAFMVHFVNPVEFSSYVHGKNYFEVLDANIERRELEKDYYLTFIEELILLIHGTSNSGSEKEERIFRKLK